MRRLVLLPRPTTYAMGFVLLPDMEATVPDWVDSPGAWPARKGGVRMFWIERAADGWRGEFDESGHPLCRCDRDRRSFSAAL